MRHLILSILVLSLFFFSGCQKDGCQKIIEQEGYKPVYMSFEEFRSSVKTVAPQPIHNPGKIYKKDAYLLINEKNQGIHIVDNSQPSNPQKLSFIKIPGNIDISVKGDVLYADSFIDLLTLDISDPTNVKVLDRKKDVFGYNPHQFTPYEGPYSTKIDRDKGVVIDWKKGVITNEVNCESSSNPGFSIESSSFDAGQASSASGSQTTSGQGGSMARFAISSNYLYTVRGEKLQVFGISSPTNPNHVADEMINRNIETIFINEPHLYIGAQDGMHIFSIETPNAPSYLSTFEHVQVCDPVVVKDDFAYVTLRGSGDCGRSINQLDIVDITDKSDPTLKRSYPMNEPFGLGIDGDNLFVCDRGPGIRVYNTEDTPQLEQINEIAVNKPYDVIPVNDLLMVTTENAIYQYDYSNSSSISELSELPVEDDPLR